MATSRVSRTTPCRPNAAPYAAAGGRRSRWSPSTSARRQTATISALRILAMRTLQQSTALRPSSGAKNVVNLSIGW